MRKEKKISELFRPKIGKSNQKCRESWLEHALSNIPQKSKILDAGAGTQQYKKFCKHLDYLSQDFAQYDGLGDHKGIQTGSFDYGRLDIISDITHIPLPDKSLDAIMCIEVLEHLPEPSEAIREFSRLLKPNGYLILTAPFASLTHFAPYHFSTGFNRYWYEQHLPERHLDIEEITPNGNYFEFIGQELYRIRNFSKKYANDKPGILESIALFFVRKMLLRFSKRDTKSSESLCFGYHVVARKK